VPGGRGERDDRTEQQVDAVDRLRATLANGFAFVRSREVNASIATITFEEAVEQAIADIQEDDSDIRLGKLSEVRRIRRELTAAVEEARRLPPEVFDTSRGQGDANTTIDGDGPSAELDEGETDI
jgi:hypothetical protein